MEVILLIFAVLSLLVLIYLWFILYSRKRLPIFLEVFYVFIYSFILLIVLFPKIISAIELNFGINNLLQVLVYLSIFVAYFLILLLFKRNEELRSEITTLVREIALIENGERRKRK